jgi:hypothetical protein
MTNESNCPVNYDSDASAEVKASDFFPPGTGWNKAPAIERKPTAEQPDSQPAGRH